MVVASRKAYPTDLTEEQWEIIKPLIPQAKRGGRPRKVDMREVMNTIRYLLRAGCPWDLLPHDLLPKSTVHDYLTCWNADGTLQRMVDALREQVRVREPVASTETAPEPANMPSASAEALPPVVPANAVPLAPSAECVAQPSDSSTVAAVGDTPVRIGVQPAPTDNSNPSTPSEPPAKPEKATREPTPSAACIDSQSTKTTEVGGIKGFDGGKKVKGRKRHIMTDTLGLLMTVAVTAANVNDGVGGQLLLKNIKPADFPRLSAFFVDNGYKNQEFQAFVKSHSGGKWTLVFSIKEHGQKGFKPVRIRWVVERTHAWLNRNRRLSKDYERKTENSEAMIRLAAISQMLNRLAPPTPKVKFNYPKKKAS